MVIQATLAQSVHVVKLVSSDLKVLLASPEALDHPGYLESLVTQDRMDSRVTAVNQALLVSVESRERSVLPVILVSLVRPVVLAPEDKSVNLDRLEPLVQRDPRVRQDSKAGLAIQGSLDSLEILVLLVKLDHLEALAIKDSKVSKVLVELSVPQENQVSWLQSIDY